MAPTSAVIGLFQRVTPLAAALSGNVRAGRKARSVARCSRRRRRAEVLPALRARNSATVDSATSWPLQAVPAVLSAGRGLHGAREPGRFSQGVIPLGAGPVRIQQNLVGGAARRARSACARRRAWTGSRRARAKRPCRACIFQYRNTQSLDRLGTLFGSPARPQSSHRVRPAGRAPNIDAKAEKSRSGSPSVAAPPAPSRRMCNGARNSGRSQRVDRHLHAAPRRASIPGGLP